MKAPKRFNRAVCGWMVRPLVALEYTAYKFGKYKLMRRLGHLADICLDVEFGTQYRKAYR